MALHKPIVTTDFIGAYEQIEDEINGFIVNQNENDIYKKIKFIIDNKAISDKVIKNLESIILDTTDDVNKLISYIE